MKKTTDRRKQFSEQELLAEQPRIIDIYTQNADRIKPLRLLFSFYKGHYGQLLLSALFYLIKDTPSWVLPLLTARIINLITAPPQDVWAQLLVCVVIAGVVLALNVPFHNLHITWYSKASRAVEAGLRGAMIRKLQQLSISFHKEMESGKIQQKIMQDVTAVTSLSTSLLNTALGVAVNMAISLGVILSSDLRVFLMFLMTIPVMVLLRRFFAKKMRTYSHEFRKELEHTSSAVYDMEELIPVTRAHALEQREIRKLTADVMEVAEQGSRLDRLHSWFGALSFAVTNFFKILCLFFTAYLAITGDITVGEVSLYQTYFATLTGYVSSIIGLLPTITGGAESIRSIGEILAAFDVEENKGKPKLKTLQGRYEFKNVVFDYDERTHVLQGLDLTVEPGETVALVGESGSGKSTIINLVIGFNKPTAGQLLIDGQDVNDIDLQSYRKMLSVVPQNSILFSGTIRQNITYGRSHITKEVLDGVIKAARLESVIESLPDGLSTKVGEHGSKLSGGQRQRISIARAIIRDPRVIIFDEATSALDSVTEREIQEAIDDLTRDRTTFIVAHRLSTIKNADKIAVIKDGRCVEYGTWDELLEKKGEFYRYKMAQS